MQQFYTDYLMKYSKEYGEMDSIFFFLLLSSSLNTNSWRGLLKQ